MIAPHVPVDSADAAEQREREDALLEVEAEQIVEHDRTCRGGWLGEDLEGRPIPCPRCRPWLAHTACRECQAPFQSCENLRTIRRGPCCEHCDHTPRVRHTHPRRGDHRVPGEQP